MTPAAYVRTAVIAGFALLAMLGFPFPASATWVLKVAAAAIVTLAAILNVLGTVPSRGKVQRLGWGFYVALCPILILHLLAIDGLIAEFGVWLFAGSSTLAAAGRAALTLSLVAVLQASLWAANEHVAGDPLGGKHNFHAAAATSAPPTNKAERMSQAVAETRASGAGVANRPRSDQSSPASETKGPIADRTSAGDGIVRCKDRTVNNNKNNDDRVNKAAAPSASPGMAQRRPAQSTPGAIAAGGDTSAQPTSRLPADVPAGRPRRAGWVLALLASVVTALAVGGGTYTPCGLQRNVHLGATCQQPLFAAVGSADPIRASERRNSTMSTADAGSAFGNVRQRPGRAVRELDDSIRAPPAKGR